MTTSKQKSTASRILALDGLRGLAVILVILNHLRLDPLQHSLPHWFQYIYPIISQNGKTGVSLLFLLSGFLIGKLYSQVPSTLTFWQKRYTRVFPPFVAMAIVLGFIRFWWESMTPALVFVLVLLAAATGGFFWRSLQSSRHRTQLGKIVFTAFLTFQALTALWYVFVLPHTPAPVFYQVWSAWLQAIVSTVVNVTMTLPFGIYIGQLDGVYWSLTIEILFYLLYPVLLLPLFRLFSAQKSVLLKGVSLTTTLLFLYGLSFAFRSFLGFNIFTIGFFFYFIVGLTVAHWEKSKKHGWKTFQEAIIRSRWLGWTTGLIILFGTPYLFPIVPHQWHTLLQIGLALPLAIVLVMSLGKNLFSRTFAHPLLVWIGSISYSLYLTHTIAIEIFVKHGPPQTVAQTLWIGSLSVIMSFVLALGLNTWLEKPYFQRDSAPSEFIAPSWWQQLRHRLLQRFQPRRRSSLLPLLTILGFLTCFFIWKANRPPLPLTALIFHHQQDIAVPSIDLNQEALSFPFVGQENNLGMLTLNLDRQLAEKNHDTAFGIPQFIAQVTDNEDQVIGYGEHNTIIMSEGKNFPIGLALQPQSQNTSYTVHLSVKNPAPGLQLLIGENSTIDFQSVYFPSKRDLLTHPARLLAWIKNLLLTPFYETLAQRELFLTIPLIAWGMLLLGKSYWIDKHS